MATAKNITFITIDGHKWMLGNIGQIQIDDNWIYLHSLRDDILLIKYSRIGIKSIEVY